MAPHQERVIAEKNDLEDRLHKLQSFTLTGLFMSLPQDEQGRLFRQSKIMDLYRDVLIERIAAFKE